MRIAYLADIKIFTRSIGVSKNLIMIAGPYGASKTRYAQSALGAHVLQETHVDPQYIYDGLKSFHANTHVSVDDYAARTRKKTISTRFEQIFKQRSFSTTCSLADIEDLDLLDAARENGYQISLYYFGLKSWQSCVARINKNSAHWMAGSSEEIIYGNYHRSLAMLSGAIPLADHGFVYDVSGKSEAKPLLAINQGRVEILQKKIPEWIIEPLTRCL